MFEDKIEAMNKLPNAVDDSSVFEKRVYTVEEIMDILSIGKNTAYGCRCLQPYHRRGQTIQRTEV